MTTFLISIPARISLYVNADSSEQVTEELVASELLDQHGKFVELDVETEVFVDQFEIIDSD